VKAELWEWRAVFIFLVSLGKLVASRGRVSTQKC
jgi:hypothetical protein